MPILPSRSGNFLFLSFYIVFLCIGRLRGMSKSKDGAMLFAQTHLYAFILIWVERHFATDILVGHVIPIAVISYRRNGSGQNNHCSTTRVLFDSRYAASTDAHKTLMLLPSEKTHVHPCFVWVTERIWQVQGRICDVAHSNSRGVARTAAPIPLRGWVKTTEYIPMNHDLSTHLCETLSCYFF